MRVPSGRKIQKVAQRDFATLGIDQPGEGVPTKNMRNFDIDQVRNVNALTWRRHRFFHGRRMAHLQNEFDGSGGV